MIIYVYFKINFWVMFKKTISVYLLSYPDRDFL